MNPITLIYNEALYRPLFNLLVGITNMIPTHSIGWSIIAVTFLVRLALLPSSWRHAKQMQRQQGKMQNIQKELAEIKEKYKDDKAKQAEETMKLYRTAGINPASGCLPLLIQLPILLALYKVFSTQLGPDAYSSLLYSFVNIPVNIHTMFLGVELTKPSIVFAALAGIGQFIQMKWLAPTPPTQPAGDSEDAAAMVNSMQKNMAYIFPVMTIFIGLQFPAALTLYWFVSTLFGIAQQYILKRTLHLAGNPPVV